MPQQRQTDIIGDNRPDVPDVLHEIFAQRREDEGREDVWWEDVYIQQEEEFALSAKQCLFSVG